ncbi:hypothetical protein [Klebsiella quasipneumoniae]|nr:hypothetical protein [Klebsiella quasipneumoniae]MDQ6438979.1 hypothetical protein [Klebsiella quasipneumoniae]
MSWKLSRTVLRGGAGGNFGTLLDSSNPHNPVARGERGPESSQ